MPQLVTCESIQTATGEFGDSLRTVPAQQLAANVISDLVNRTQAPPDAIDDIVLSHGSRTMDAPVIGGVVSLDAGLPTAILGTQIDRRCGSRLQAVLDAAMQVRTGVSAFVIDAGTDSMNDAPFHSTEMRYDVTGVDGVTLHDALTRGRFTAEGKHHPLPGGMTEMAENMRQGWSHPCSRDGPPRRSLQSLNPCALETVCVLCRIRASALTRRPLCVLDESTGSLILYERRK
jgi:acetyl-CoA C-acetyltransferase